MSELTLDDFWSILHHVPETKPIFFRLYYNNDGTPITYSMEELSHDYIEVEPEVFHQRNMNVQVVNNNLIFKPTTTVVNKLHPANSGIACDPRDVCVVVSTDQPNRLWKIIKHELN
jgi:hypothetical protein